MFKQLLFAATFAAAAYAESHTVKLTNRCGYGTPMLTGQSGNVLSTGSAYTAYGELIGARAWLQNGSCGGGGTDCTIIEITLRNPQSAGAGSSVDISLIEPGNKFTTAAGFVYFNGCDGQGKYCNNPDCSEAFHNPWDYQAQVQCEVNDVDIEVTFC
ncbi:glycopeptide [Armillaria novae-zelandiae]|uniref:Glycopeptide n=1 Tax=Armillaria novae-zelandiae TaxID=153914 RepID=A0AA39ULR0_9AGAR|nr:glycopeptide [Armillaria novae-zelandiae]